jgi:hypothetical protein
MKQFLASAATAALMTLAISGSASAATVVYDFTLGGDAFPTPGAYGSVTVTDLIDASLNPYIHFDVSLASGFGFVDTGSHDGSVFEFKNNPDNAVAITITNLSAGWRVATPSQNLPDPPFEDSPFGSSWDYAITCLAPAPGGGCDNGGSSPAPSPMSFDVYGMTTAQIGSNAYTKNGVTYDVYYAADVLGAGGATGVIGATISAVPEPSTWALMIAGFGLIGFAMRRRPKQEAAYA